MDTETKKTRIGFSTTTNPLSKFIRWVTGASCSHVWFVYWDASFEMEMVMHAHWTYELIPYDIFKKQNIIVSVITPKSPIDAAIKSSVVYLGTWFDGLGLLGMGWVKLGRWLKHRWLNPFRSSRSVYCSEAVTRGLVGALYPGFSANMEETTGPDDLLTFFQKESSG